MLPRSALLEQDLPMTRTQGERLAALAILLFSLGYFVLAFGIFGFLMKQVIQWMLGL